MDGRPVAQKHLTGPTNYTHKMLSFPTYGWDQDAVLETKFGRQRWLITYFDHMEGVPLCNAYPTLSNKQKHKIILNFIAMNQSIQKNTPD